MTERFVARILCVSSCGWWLLGGPPLAVAMSVLYLLVALYFPWED